MNIPNQKQTEETRDVVSKSIVIKEIIRICSNPHSDKNKDIKLQKTEIDKTHTSDPSKRETNIADNQDNIQTQPRRKEEKGNPLKEIGQRESNVIKRSDTTIKGPKECIYQGDKTESKSQEIQPHESEAAYTPKTLEKVFQTHQAEVDKQRHTKQEKSHSIKTMNNEDSKSTHVKKSDQQT
jgi:hypothetical protein